MVHSKRRSAGLTSPALSVLSEVLPIGPQATDRDLIVGRDREIFEIAQTLQLPGFCPVIIGPSGVGKSTLAKQAELIAQGSVEILGTIKAGRYQHAAETAFLTTFFSCSPRIVRDTSSLLIGILALLRHEQEKISAPPGMRPVERSVTVGFPLKAELTQKYQRNADSGPPGMERLDEQVIDAALDLSEISGRPILVIVDDLDQISDSVGLAAFISLVSHVCPDQLRFVFVGRGSRPNALISDYGSIVDLVVAVELGHLHEDEILRMILMALKKLNDQGMSMVLDDELAKSIATISGGIPAAAVHLTRDSIRRAERDGRDSVVRRDLDLAVGRMISLVRESR